MNYTQAQIDRANAVSLEDFLRTQGETLIKSGREYRWKEHDSLTVRGNKWFRHSQSKGGYPIDFVMEFYGKSFPEAVQLLTGESAEGQSEASTAPPTAFHLPLHNRTADRAIQYLTESRGLNKTLVEAFLLSGDIYEDAKRHNVVFVGRDRSGTPRYAHVRGTADPFRQDIAGSDKSYPFHYEGNGNQLFVFEAPIDLLSFICLYPQDWQTRSYLALGGVSGKALDRFLSERKDIRKVFLCLDSDTAGSEACTRLAQDIPGEIAVIRLVPARKDWNDVLRQQGDIPSRKFIAETITLRELPTAQPVPMLRINNLDEDSFVYVKGNFEPIVSESLWHECERIRKSRISSLRLPDGETRRKGTKTTKNLWVSKLRCRCGSSYRIFKWRKLKDGTPVFGYQCNMRTVNPTRSFVLEHGLTDQLSCDAISVPEWKLDLMAKKIFEKVWDNQNKAILLACQMIEGCKSGKPTTLISAAPIQSKIEKIKNRKMNYAAMRADGELGREEYQALCKQADDEINRLEQDLKSIAPEPDSAAVSANMKALHDFLEQKLDVRGACLAPELIEQFVEVVTPISDYT